MNGGEVIFKFLGDDKGLEGTMKKLGSIGSMALKGLAVGTTAVATGFTALVTASVKARGEMEQIAGGTQKIFDEMDYKQIEKDAQEAYKTMNLSARDYLDMMNKVGATFAQTMGDQKGYDTAKKGMQAIADYASGTGADINTLNEKFKLITRSTSSYQSIADQFAGILPQTTKDFLAQAQASGFLSQEYKKLTDVPVAEYQQAVSQMLEKGVDDMGLLGNTYKESTDTMTGSIAMLKTSWDNFLSGTGDLGTVAENAGIAFDNIMKIVDEAIPQIADQIVKHLPQLIETGMKLLSAVAQGVAENMPMLMDTAWTILETLGTTLNDNLDTILDKGIEIVLKIVEGISNKLPDLIPVAIEIITKIATSLLEHLPEILAMGINLIQKLALGIIQAIPDLLASMFKIVNTIRNTILNLVGQLPRWRSTINHKFQFGYLKYAR